MRPSLFESRGAKGRSALIGLDFNADRVLAAAGGEHASAHLIHLDGDRLELPLAILLEKRRLQVGRAGLTLCRQYPHLTVTGFLSRLGTPDRWCHRRHRLDACQALAAFFRELQPRLPQARGIMLAVPGYLSHEQCYLLARTGQESGLPVMGTLPRALAASLNSYLEHPWQALGLVVDVDDHALTLSAVRAQAGAAELGILAERVYPMLGLRLWRDRLLRRVADQCIRLCRRDPRESPDADQMLFNQFDLMLEGQSQNKVVLLDVQSGGWYQRLALQPAEAAAACRTLAGQAARQVAAAIAWAERQKTEVAIYLTAGAARLPGLVGAIYEQCENKVAVVVLPASAPALGAFRLARRIDQGELEPGLLGPAVSLARRDQGEPPPVLPFRELEKPEPADSSGPDLGFGLGE